MWSRVSESAAPGLAFRLARKADIWAFKEARATWEKNYIIRLLKKNKGNVKKTAEAMGKYRSDLYNLIKKYSIDPESFR